MIHNTNAMNPQKELSKLIRGDFLDHYLLVRKCEPKTTQHNKPYIVLELCDQSAALTAYLWDIPDEFDLSSMSGAVVKVSGVIEEYKSQLQIRISGIRPACGDDDVSPEDFLAKSRRDFVVMKRELENRISRFRNVFLKQLLKQILSGEFYERFLRAPAGKSWHHSYIHGLLEHTLEIIKICDFMCDIHPELNRDLLISGAILHDSGKVEELVFNSAFDYSDKGKLLGHIIIGALEINEKANKVSGFPEDLKVQLIHLVLSHQGKLEYASPVVPKTLESIVLYQADELSAKTNAYKSAIMAESGSSSKWTKHLSLISTALYIPDNFGQEDPQIVKTLFDS